MLKYFFVVEIFSFHLSLVCKACVSSLLTLFFISDTKEIYHSNLPIDRAIIFFVGFGVIFILSTMDLIGLNVVFAVTEAGICHRLLFAVDIP